MLVVARSRLTSKEQLSLPAAIRRMLGVHAGDELVWIQGEDGRISVEPARAQSLADIRKAVEAEGPRCPPRARALTLRRMKNAIGAHLRAKHGGR